MIDYCVLLIDYCLLIIACLSIDYCLLLIVYWCCYLTVLFSALFLLILLRVVGCLWFYCFVVYVIGIVIVLAVVW